MKGLTKKKVYIQLTADGIACTREIKYEKIAK